MNKTVFDVAVDVESMYLPHESDPSRFKFVFAYEITIRNDGDISAHLLSRHWYVRHAEDKVDEVKGDGVVGKQPWIEPGQSFKYVSGAVLETPFGSMQGSYLFEDENQNQHEVPIPEFLLLQDTSTLN